MQFNRQVIWLNIIFWMGMFLAHFYVQYNPNTEFDTWPETIAFSYGTLLNVIAIYGFAHFGVPAYIKKPAIRTLMRYNVLFILVFVGLETTIDTLYQYFYNDFYKIITRDSTYFKDLITANVISMLFIMTMANLYALSLAWLKDTQRRGEADKEKLKAELALMKHQIQPHFLFNTLNNLFGLACETGNEKVADGISKLAEIMRYMTYETEAEKVDLSKEIRYLQSYIELQKLRTGDKIDIDFQVVGNIIGKKIAPLLLLPFVENAFKHGISFIEPKPIKIIMKIAAEKLIFEVKNHIHRQRRKGEEEGGFGLHNVRKRLDLVYPDEHTLLIEQKEGQFNVYLQIKKI